MIVLLTIIVCVWAAFLRRKHPPLAEVMSERRRAGKDRGWRFFTGKRTPPVEVMIVDFPRACREYMKTHDYREVTRTEPITP